MSQALGLIETKGYVGNVEAADAMAKAADVDLTFSLILEDGWSLDLTCNSAPGHHLAVRGFELARKHHMQEGHKGHNPRQSKRKDASGMAKATAALHNAHLLYAETKHGSHGSGSRIVVGAAPGSPR